MMFGYRTCAHMPYSSIRFNRSWGFQLPESASSRLFGCDGGNSCQPATSRVRDGCQRLPCNYPTIFARCLVPDYVWTTGIIPPLSREETIP